MAKNPLLWHGRRRVEIQAVRSAHRVLCSGCENVPKVRRLVITEGGGRSSTVLVYCMACGVSWINERRVEAERAITLLQTGQGFIRL